MKRTGFIFITITLLTAAILFSSCSIKQVQYTTRTVTVSGTGTVETENDTATIILSVITRAKDPAESAGQNADRMTAVTQAVTALGIPEKNISTQNYSINQEISYSSGRTVYGDYRVSNEIKITLKDITLASTVIDTAVKAGANQLSSLVFGSSNADLALRQARTAAIQQAQDAATLLAGTSGAKLGKVLKIDEVSGAGIPRLYRLKSANDAITAESASWTTPVMGGETSVSVTIDVVYELK